MSKTTENYGLTKPEVGEFFSLETWNENMDKIDGELKKREDAQKESDNSLMNPKFTEAKERKNLTSGEKIHLMLGKISRFFSDMKAIAFSGSYNDLVDKPKIPTVLNNQTTTEEGYALDARQANPNIDGTLAKQVADLNGSLNSKADTEYFSHDIYNSWVQTPFRENKYTSRMYAAFDNILGAYTGIMTLTHDKIDSNFNCASSRLGFIPTVLDSTSDLNDVIGNRFIQANGAKNSPKSGLNVYGFNISWLTDTNFVFQLLIAPNEELISGSTIPRLYMRSKNAGTWTKWYVITGTSLS